MNFIKKHIKSIAVVLVIVLILSVTYFVQDRNYPVQNVDETPVTLVESPPTKEMQAPTVEHEVNTESIKQPEVSNEIVKKSDSEKADTCTLSVRCDTILENIENLVPDKVAIVPEDGVILPETEVVFEESENLFDVLKRTLTEAKIHLEFIQTPIYNSAYIEGIANIYEYDCGELSGWMYKVNGYFPNYGCSQYKIQSGDKIEWVYTCDLGVDVGGEYSARNGM